MRSTNEFHVSGCTAPNIDNEKRLAALAAADEGCDPEVWRAFEDDDEDDDEDGWNAFWAARTTE